MENLPLYIQVVFALTTFLTVFLFYRASGNSKLTMIILLAWLIIQTVMGLSGFYLVTDTTPPRFLLLIGPPLLFIIGMFSTGRGRDYIDHLNLKVLTILHIIRIPVEVVLFWLFIHKGIPELMTFEGRNFDILSGLTAPIIYYVVFRNGQRKNKILLFWNIVCLCLLINIVLNAALSVPSPIQKFAFDQPNVAILLFAFNWLPACVVPLVLLSHLAALRQLSRTKDVAQRSS